MQFSILYSGEQILSFKSCLIFYAGDSLSNLSNWAVVISRISFAKFDIFVFFFFFILIVFCFLNIKIKAWKKYTTAPKDFGGVIQQ